MKRWPFFAIASLVAIMALALIPATLFGQSNDEAPLTVSGTLVNGTAGGPLPAGVPTLLHLFGADSGSVNTLEAITDGDGSFSFDAVQRPPPGASIALVAAYGGTRYSRVLSPADLSQALTLTVYEPTQNIGVVSTTEQSIIVAGIDVGNRRITAVQLFTLENRTDTTLVPDLSVAPLIGQFSFLRFSMPPEASDLNVSTDLVGGEVIPVGTGFAITAPVPPGRHQVSFTFSFPYADDSVAWRDNTLQGAESFRLLIPSEFGNVGVGGLPALEAVTVGSITYGLWGQDAIAPGEGVDLTLSGLPQPSWITRLGHPLREVRFWYLALPVLVGIVLAGLLVWGTLRPHAPESGDPTGT